MGIDVWAAERDPAYLRWLPLVSGAHLGGDGGPSSAVGLTHVTAFAEDGGELHLCLHHVTGDICLSPTDHAFADLLAEVLASCRARVDGRWTGAAEIHRGLVAAHGEVASIEFFRGMGGEFTRLLAADGAAAIVSES